MKIEYNVLKKREYFLFAYSFNISGANDKLQGVNFFYISCRNGKIHKLFKWNK